MNLQSRRTRGDRTLESDNWVYRLGSWMTDSRGSSTRLRFGQERPIPGRASQQIECWKSWCFYIQNWVLFLLFIWSYFELFSLASELSWPRFLFFFWFWSNLWLQGEQQRFLTTTSCYFILHAGILLHSFPWSGLFILTEVFGVLVVFNEALKICI